MLLGVSVVTLIPRVLPLIVLSKIELPEWGMRWLNHIPIAVMSALLAQELLVSNGSFAPSPQGLIAALPAFVVAFISRSLLATVITGLVAMMLLRNFGSLLGL